MLELSHLVRHKMGDGGEDGIYKTRVGARAEAEANGKDIPTRDVHAQENTLKQLPDTGALPTGERGIIGVKLTELPD